MKHTISTTSIFFILTTLSLLVHRPLESMESDNSERSDSQRSAGSWSELRFSPDPTLASRLERIQECLVKHRLKPIITPDGFVFLESAADEQEVPQKETAPFPFIQTLTEKIRATPCVKNRYTLLSCVFYLHEFLTAVLSEIIERSSKTADPIRDLIEAFSLLDDAIKHYKKQDPMLLKFWKARPVSAKNKAPSPREFQPPTAAQVLEEHMAALIIICNESRTISLAQNDPEESRIRQEKAKSGNEDHIDASLIFEALCTLLQAGLNLKKERESLSTKELELADIIISLCEQRPELIDLDTLSLDDLHRDPFLLTLFTRKTQQIEGAVNTYSEMAGHPGLHFSLLTQLIRNKKMLMALSLTDQPDAFNEGEAADAPKEKDDTSPEWDLLGGPAASVSGSDSKRQRARIWEQEYSRLKQRLIALVRNNPEISVHDIILIGDVVKADELSHMIQRKMNLDQEISEIVFAAATSDTYEATARRCIGVIAQLSEIIKKLRNHRYADAVIRPLALKRATAANQLLHILSALTQESKEKVDGILRELTEQAMVVLVTPELHTAPILCCLENHYKKEYHTHGTDLLITLFEAALRIRESLESLPKKDFFESIETQDLAQLVREEGLLQEKKLAFDNEKARAIRNARSDLDEIAHAMSHLIAASPELIAMGLIKLETFAKNKHLLLLLVNKLLTQPDPASDQKADAEALAFHLAALGSASGPAHQTRHALALSHKENKAHAERETRRLAELLPGVRDAVQEYERILRDARSSLEAIKENQSATFADALKDNTKKHTGESLSNELDSILRECKEPFPHAANQIQLLRAWQGNARELLDRGLLVNAENHFELTAYALLINHAIQEIETELHQRLEKCKALEQKHEQYLRGVQQYSQALEEIAVADQQATTDLIDIAAALHALHKQFPEAISPSILTAYPQPALSWWDWAKSYQCILQ